jgi:hypothetical protein
MSYQTKYGKNRVERRRRNRATRFDELKNDSVKVGFIERLLAMAESNPKAIGHGKMVYSTICGQGAMAIFVRVSPKNTAYFTENCYGNNKGHYGAPRERAENMLWKFANYLPQDTCEFLEEFHLYSNGDRNDLLNKTRREFLRQARTSQPSTCLV